ncbi:hypothetical protein BD408DRAFT_411738 [Parasitella parasitica]|nr:hypothetical protein BD408DRAFT_411738 [Parasitella parasitica]
MIERTTRKGKIPMYLEKESVNAYLQDQDERITTQESATIIKITSFIRPFIPSSETYHLLSCQLKFILMANQVLRSIGYEGQVAKFIPLVRPTTLHALLIDTTTLYALFCSSKLSKRMYLRDFQGNYVKHKDANAKKDAVFNSFFNIEKLKAYGMEFLNIIHIIPGSKTVRLYGSIGHFKSSRRNPETKSKLNHHTDDDHVRGLKRAWRTNFEEQKQCYEKVEDAQESDKTSDLTKTWKVKVEEKDERYQNVNGMTLFRHGKET